MTGAVAGRRHCPACDGHSADTLFSQRFVLPEEHPLSGGYDVRLCGRCGMAYASPLPSQEQYNRYYERLSKYSTPGVSSGSGVQPWDEARLQDMATFVAGLVPLAAGARSLVDVGCGAGGSLPCWAAAGFSPVIGVDPSPQCVAAARAHVDARGITATVLPGTFDTLPTAATGADVYVLSHVLEHVREVRGTLQGLRQVAKPESHLYVEVPDAARFDQFPASPLLEFNTEHINYFGHRSLARALYEAGWHVEQHGQRVVRNGPTTTYPVAWALARATASAADSTPAAGRDDDTGEALRRYVRQGAEQLRTLESRLAGMALHGREVVVWGTGQTSAILLAQPALRTLTVRAFVDSDPRFAGMHIGGVPVLSVETLRAHPEWTIFIASVLAERSIRASIASLALPNPILPLSELIS